MIESDSTNPVLPKAPDPLSRHVLVPAAELLTALARVEPKLEALCSVDRNNTKHEHWFHDDTPATLKAQRKAWRRVEADIWRLSWGLITLGHVHRCSVLDGIPPDEQEYVRYVFGFAKKEGSPASTIDREGTLAVFTDDRLVDSLYGLTEALRSWEWYAATESSAESTPEEIGDLVLKRLAAVAAAAWESIGQTVLERIEEARS